ncbi:OmpA family protein [Brevundimonas variabilis]|uniref:Outer membrane protein OmpA-like peptidoglycan-associated protein n=1 Tax=Brevundimonas variabilis TaxID=74312 RepID=A0A7W9CG59_9CAUL|nr:OmpA family protein [Brevundimonas variabilis]MBB5745029.1 outer membrane protein OmpA-like peptidoglycan-associated protein [Brevundimonas variabilis]
MRFVILAATAAAIAGLSACASGRAPARESIVAAPTDCRSQTFEVYFADGEARLTETARQVIGLTATQLQGCDIQRVQVIGLADASGAASLNQTLSQRRATAVAEALAAAGWPTPVFEVAAAGGQGATVAPGVAEPLRRRTEVIVTAAPL